MKSASTFRNGGVDQPLSEMADRALALSSMGSFVGNLYLNPVNETVAETLLSLGDDDIESLFLEQPTCVESVRNIKEFLNAGESSLASAKADFHKLFVGPDRLLAAPWSSVYLDLGTLFGPTALAVEKHMKTHHVAPEGSKNEPWDHIGYELSFLSFGTEEIAEALNNEDHETAVSKAQELLEFKRQFIDSWVPDFFNAIQEAKGQGMYGEVVQLTKGFLILEDTFLCDVCQIEAA